jgi:hypothetical protein
LPVAGVAEVLFDAALLVRGLTTLVLAIDFVAPGATLEAVLVLLLLVGFAALLATDLAELLVVAFAVVVELIDFDVDFVGIFASVAFDGFFTILGARFPEKV